MKDLRKTTTRLLLLCFFMLTLTGCVSLGYCEADGRYYYLDENGVEQSTAMADPGGPRYCPASPQPEPLPIVVDEMWLLVNDDDGNWCVLIAESHPSVASQERLCFPGESWVATNALCAAPVYDDGTPMGHWPCDGPLHDWRVRTNGGAGAEGRADLERLREINERHEANLEEMEGS
jgi:hypothetical protein